MLKVPIVGVPYDGRSSGRPGARYGPSAVRNHQELLEEYSPFWEDYVFFDDLGDIPGIPLEDFVDHIVSWMRERDLKSFVAIGGDHSVTIPLVRYALGIYKDLFVVSLDAHLDLRDTYLGDPLSHACVLRRIFEMVDGRVFQVGGRSGDREEWEFGRRMGIVFNGSLLSSLERALCLADGRPVYLTIDLDVFDPSFLPGTGTPEPGGISPNQFFEALEIIRFMDVVAVDVVELNPVLDPSGVSTLLACKVLREVSPCLKR